VANTAALPRPHSRRVRTNHTSGAGARRATTYPDTATASTTRPPTNGARVPTRSTSDPAGAFARMRATRLALRMTPTTNGEMPMTAPRFGRMGKTTPPPNPTKKVLAMTAPTTVRSRFTLSPGVRGSGSSNTYSPRSCPISRLVLSLPAVRASTRAVPPTVVREVPGDPRFLPARSPGGDVREYPFELALCAHLERERDAVVARQLGGGVEAPGNRVVDVVLLEPGPAFDERARVTDRAIPLPAIEGGAGPGRFRDWRAAVDRPPERARGVVDHAVDVGFFERERRGGREHVRQVARYPGRWFDGLVAVENKPDLGTPGDLETQLRKDVSLGLFDAAVLATASHVTGAHLNRVPDPVGVWRVDTDGDPDVEVVRAPTPLAVDDPGVELLETHPGRTDVAVVDADAKARARRRVAERAYGKGWRPADLPGCAEAAAGEVAGAGALPYCDWKGRLVDPAGCGPSCPGYDAADPPAADPETERDARSPWVADPEGATRHQSGLDRFR
jgi:hypothetical protein